MVKIKQNKQTVKVVGKFVGINNSLHLAEKYVRILVCRYYLFEGGNSFPRV